MQEQCYRSFVAKPFAAFDKDGNPVNLQTVLSDIADMTVMLTEVASWQIRTDTNLLQDVREYDNLKPAVAGRKLGIKFPEELMAGWKSGKSRMHELLSDRVVREVRSWSERDKAVNGESTKYISQGWSRTMNNSRPDDLIPEIHLSAADRNFSRMQVEHGILILDMVVQGTWMTLHFHMPRNYDEGRITLPNIRIVDGKPEFIFTNAVEYIYTEMSSQYVVGVDVGKVYPATVVVWDREGRVVEATTLSRRVHSLTNSIRASERQITALQKAGRKDEAALHRQKNSRKKRELAILIGQEVADLTYTWGNAPVAVEDLSWIRNTMENGRWNRGEVVRWISHFVELNGCRVLSVKASYTSQICHMCGKSVTNLNDRTSTCQTHGVFDRDVNAAANIAQRLTPQAVETRKKAQKCTKRKVRRTSVTRDSLKYPGRDRTKNGLTPKRPSGRRKVYSRCHIEDGTVLRDGAVQSECGVRTLEKQYDQSTDGVLVVCRV